MNVPKTFFILLLISAVFLCGCSRTKNATYHEGDIVFQVSRSSQSKAIQLATGSKYCHMGVLLMKDGQLQVFEAVQPVKYTPLVKWIRRGNQGKYVVKRLCASDRETHRSIILKMHALADTIVGKPYDLTFMWSDDEWYCSELVWKMYQRCAGIELCRLKKLKDFDLTNPIVRQLMSKRYGRDIPFDEPVVSPADIFSSGKLCQVP